MTGTLRRFGSALVFGLALCVPNTFGQVEIRFNGSTASPVILQPGDQVTFEVAGPRGAPFAALFSPAPCFVVTQYGILFADPLHEDAVIFYDGFNQWHPAYGSSVLPFDGSPLTQDFVPFVDGAFYAPAYYVQALIADPGSPGGLVLTNHIVLAYDPPPPQVASLQPNIVSPPAEITIVGSDFNPNPALDTVFLNGLECPVIAATHTWLTVLIPAGARSGTITVETPEGTSAVNADSIATWLAVASPAFYLETQTPLVIDEASSIIGDLAVGEHMDFVVHIEPGEELSVEMYVFDPTTFRVSGWANPATQYFDPFLRVRRNPDMPVTVLIDDDSGPNVTGAVGLVKGSPRYVASVSEDLVVQVDSQNGQSAGPFLVLISTRPATNLPVTVQAVVPGASRIGDVVLVLGTGFDPSQPDQHTVLLNGAVAPAFEVTFGTLQFVIPPGILSGPVMVSAPAGTSPYDQDSIQSWLCIYGYTEIYEVEGTTPTVTTGVLVRGQIAPVFDADEVLIDLTAGQKLSLECHPWDPGSGNLTGGAVLSATPVDPEIRLFPMTTSSVLGVDQNSGPALSAGFGLNPGNLPFTAPYTGTFRIRVSSFFGWSLGHYVLAINPAP